ncbi:hypothetical protein K0M31_003970 [Melipona bicolor]|uniref:Uncharacterized protein n=1 Tax=Melipona bicolor TaxID=60889 RepID=A0AA40FXY8_9HYME|nr:hypothetical protein K0M31_003970 [Melipona bicolor]
MERSWETARKTERTKKKRGILLGYENSSESWQKVQILVEFYDDARRMGFQRLIPGLFQFSQTLYATQEDGNFKQFSELNKMKIKMPLIIG